MQACPTLQIAEDEETMVAEEGEMGERETSLSLPAMPAMPIE